MHQVDFYVAFGPPTNIRVTLISPSSVEVTWDQFSSNIVIGYLISYSTNASYISETDRMRSAMVTGRSTTSVTLTNLEENTPYTITVRSDSSDGFSAPSDVVSVTTLSDGKLCIICERSSCYNSTVPSSPPQSVMVTSVNPSSLRVSWQPPPEIDRNGVITGYVIEYTRSGINNTVTATSGTTDTISALIPFVEYSVTVAAMTINGTGPYSNPPVLGTSGEDGRSISILSVYHLIYLSTKCTTKITNGEWYN